MKEFIIDEKYNQICINSEGSIEISGLSKRSACAILKDANSANMPCYMELSEDCVTINVEHNSVILKDKQLTILLNPNIK